MVLKLYFFVILTTIGIRGATAQSRTDFTMMLDGKLREFIVVKPGGVVPPGGYPVVFMFHGTSGTGELFYNTSGWKEKGETEKFISVFPTSLKYCILNFPNNNPVFLTRWNTGDLQQDKCPNLAQDFKDDVAFVRRMIDTIDQEYAIDRKKIFAAGFSNGCSMIHKLAVEASDVFAAVAGVASILQPTDSMKAERNIPLWNIVGTQDERFTAAFGVSPLPFGGDSTIQYLGSYINRMNSCFGMSNTYTRTATENSKTYTFQTPLPGGSPGRFVFTLIKNMEHIYPNGVNFPISATNYIWEFFNQTIVSSVKNESQDQSGVHIFPNPSAHQIFIKAGIKGFGVHVYDLSGKLVYQQKDVPTDEYLLNKTDIGTGNFILKISTSSETVVKKIIFE